MSRDGERRARLALSFLATPGDPVLGVALRTMAASEVLAAITGSDADGQALLVGGRPDPALGKSIVRWRARLGEVPGTGRLAAWQESGLRLIQPGDLEWPSQLHGLGGARPPLLWGRGRAGLRYARIRSLSVGGARAATGSGNHV